MWRPIQAEITSPIERPILNPDSPMIFSIYITGRLERLEVIRLQKSAGAFGFYYLSHKDALLTGINIGN